MTATGIENHPGVQRCAVCKIDRKGRFILADLVAQDLFGLSEVELFGRPLIDFIEPSDHSTIEAMTANRNPYETVFEAAPVTLLGDKQREIAATLIVSVNFGGGNPANYQIIIYTDRPPTADTASTTSQAWLEYLEYLSENDQIESAENLAQHLVALDAIASATIYETRVHDDNQLAQVGTDGPSHSPEPNIGDDIIPDREVRATFGLANGQTGLAILTVIESALEPSLSRDRAELAAVVLHALCSTGSDQDVEDGATTPASRLLDQLQIGAVELDPAGQVQHRNTVFDQLFDGPCDVESISDLIELIESKGDLTSAAAVAAYFHASSACEAPPRLRLSLGLEQIGAVALTFERLKPGTDDLSGCFLFSRVEAQSAGGQEAISGSIDLTLTALDRLRSTTATARSIWLKLEHENHNELTNDGGFYLKTMSHHLDSVEQTLIDLEQLLKSINLAEQPQVINLGLVVDKIVADLETRPSGQSLTVRHTDLPRVNAQLQKLTAALRHTIEATMIQADAAQTDISVTAEVVDGDCTISIRGDGPRLTKKQSRRAFVYVGPAASDPDGTGLNRPAGLAQARALIESMGGRISLDPDHTTGIGVRIVFPEA